MYSFGSRLKMLICTLVNPLLCSKHWRSRAILFTLAGQVVFFRPVLCKSNNTRIFPRIRLKPSYVKCVHVCVSICTQYVWVHILYTHMCAYTLAGNWMHSHLFYFFYAIKINFPEKMQISSALIQH